MVAPVCAAIGLGTMAGVLGAVRQVNPTLELEFGVVAVLCAGAGMAAGWWLARSLWRLARGPSREAEAGQLRRRVLTTLAVLGGILVAGFILAMVRMPESRRWDTFVGTLLAVGVLGTIGWLLTKLRSVFGEPDDQR